MLEPLYSLHEFCSDFAMTHSEARELLAEGLVKGCGDACGNIWIRQAEINRWVDFISDVSEGIGAELTAKAADAPAEQPNTWGKHV